MSSDTSRPSGRRLEDPARAGGGSGGPGGAAAGSSRPSDPPWIKVIGTTLRLWLRRRVLRVPDSQRIGTRYSGRIAVMLAAVVVVAAGAAGIALAVHAHAGGSHKQVFGITLNLSAHARARAAAAAADHANAEAAASWIAAEVGQGKEIGCDPATCAAILGAGYPTGGQVVLEPGVPLPGPGSLIVATAAVRAQYGGQLVSDAPAVIASFGTGAQAVQVAVVVPGGAQAYDQAASKALAARRHAGRALLRNRKVHARGAARSDLGSGLVDPRLITALRTLAARYTVYLVQFGDSGPQAGGTTPLRMAEVAISSGRSKRRAGSELGRMEKLLKAQPARYRAELLQTRLAGGIRVLEIKFLAPSPF